MKVKIHTNLGAITVELFEEQAPITVQNFLNYVDQGFYSGTIFHRVIEDFMAQGGGYTADLQRKPRKANIPNEAHNGLKNITGTISMARREDPHSANASFFFNLGDNAHLDFTEKTSAGWGYCVFGKVIEGWEIVKKIAQLEIHSQELHKHLPKQTVLIEKVEKLDLNLEEQETTSHLPETLDSEEEVLIPQPVFAPQYMKAEDEEVIEQEHQTGNQTEEKLSHKLSQMVLK